MSGRGLFGSFNAAEAGECDGCGCKTKRDERIYYEGRVVGVIEALEQLITTGHGVAAVVEKRLCMECAP